MKKNKRAMKTILGIMMTGFLAAPLGRAFAADDFKPSFIQSAADEKVEKIARGMGPETFQFKDRLAEQRVNNWNQTIRMIENSYQATPASSNTIASHAYDRSSNAQQIVDTVTRFGRLSQNFANTNTPNSYIAKSDGSVEISQNGLTVMIQHQPFRNEFGFISIRDITMQYNEDRLMTRSDTDTTDPLGNVTHAITYFTWTADSKWYAGKDTNVYKNLLSSVSIETDHTGRTVTAEYHALQFSGRFTTAFSETIDDSVYGTSSFTRTGICYNGNDAATLVSYTETGYGTDHLYYELTRRSITYNDRKQITGYIEEKKITGLDGSITTVTTVARFTYNEVANPYGQDIQDSDIPSALASSTITTETTDQYGARRTSTETMTYNYVDNKCTDATGTTIFSGRAADWTQYTDAGGNILTVTKDESDTIISAFYIDASGNKVEISPSDVIATVQPGESYRGSIISTYEVLGETLLEKTSSKTTESLDHDTGAVYKVEKSYVTNTNGLVNNTPRLLGSHEDQEILMPLADPTGSHITTKSIDTIYSYDAMSLLIAAHGTGSGHIWGAQTPTWWERDVDINVEYDIWQGRPLQTLYEETQKR